MIKNIPNKYTEEMLLKEFKDCLINKFDFFYLPIDKDVLLFINRMTAMLAMLLSISLTALISKTSTNNFIFKIGKDTNRLKFVIFVMQDVKEHSN